MFSASEESSISTNRESTWNLPTIELKIKSVLYLLTCSLDRTIAIPAEYVNYLYVNKTEQLLKKPAKTFLCMIWPVVTLFIAQYLWIS